MIKKTHPNSQIIRFGSASRWAKENMWLQKKKWDQEPYYIFLQVLPFQGDGYDLIAEVLKVDSYEEFINFPIQGECEELKSQIRALETQIEALLTQNNTNERRCVCEHRPTKLYSAKTKRRLFGIY